MGEPLTYKTRDELEAELKWKTTQIEELEAKLKRRCEKCSWFSPNKKEDLFSGRCNLLAIGMDKEDCCKNGYQPIMAEKSILQELEDRNINVIFDKPKD